jgi:hypothetical protein
VKGKIVACDHYGVSDGDVEVSRAGALGSILKNGQPDFLFLFFIVSDMCHTLVGAHGTRKGT